MQPRQANIPKLTLMHPTCGSTLTEQPFCQYCAAPFQDTLLHKDKYLSECNHAYCMTCFLELVQMKKNCTICNSPMKYKVHELQMANPRFKVKSKVRGRNAISPFESQGKMKISRVNTVAPFPFPVIEKIQSPIKFGQNHHQHNPYTVLTENDDMLMNYQPGIFDYFGHNNNIINFNNSCSIIET